MTNIATIAESIAAEYGLSTTRSAAVVERIFAKVLYAALSGAEVDVAGFGKFKVKNTPAREGHHPSSGASIIVPAAGELIFEPAIEVQEALSSSARR